MKTILALSILFCAIVMPTFAELTDADLDKIRLIVNEEVTKELTKETDVHDDRFRDEFLQVLLDRLQGEVFDVSSLAIAIREIFKKTRAKGRTFIEEIDRGALGSSEYRKTRFLSYADDARIVE